MSFYPLSGFASYLMIGLLTAELYRKKFSSPVGVFFLFMIGISSVTQDLERSFHPLSGYSSHLFVYETPDNPCSERHSSPVGVFFSFIALTELSGMTGQFSSPVGVFFLFIYDSFSKKHGFIVSSPVGVFFLFIAQITPYIMETISFRPLSG